MPDVFPLEDPVLSMPDAIPDLPSNEPELLAYANALLRSLGDVEVERTANVAALKIEVESLKRRYADLDIPLGRRSDSLTAELRRVYDALPHRGTAKSRRLAYGLLGTRKSPERLEVENEDVLRAEIDGWSPEFMSLVLTPQQPKIEHKGIFEVFRRTNVLPAGCVLHPSEERFYAKPADELDARD